MPERPLFAHVPWPAGEGLPIRDDSVRFFPRASSQWDSPADVGDPVHAFYDGAQSDDSHLGKSPALALYAASELE